MIITERDRKKGTRFPPLAFLFLLYCHHRLRGAPTLLDSEWLAMIALSDLIRDETHTTCLHFIAQWSLRSQTCFFFLYTWSHKRTWDSNSNIFLIFFKLVSWNTQVRVHTHIHTPLCTRLHHESTALLSKLFDPRSRVLSVVPQSEFQRFWDNSNVSRHILGPPRRQRQRWKMPPRSLSLSPSIVPTL